MSAQHSSSRQPRPRDQCQTCSVRPTTSGKTEGAGGALPPRSLACATGVPRRSQTTKRVCTLAAADQTARPALMGWWVACEVTPSPHRRSRPRSASFSLSLVLCIMACVQQT